MDNMSIALGFWNFNVSLECCFGACKVVKEIMVDYALMGSCKI